MKRWLKRGLITLGGIGAALWLNNTNMFVDVPSNQRPLILSHRGVHQTYAGPDRSIDSCHAGQIAPPVHGFIENTIPSMRAAFANGADVVELDVHRTADNILVAYHDWRLDCQTDGTGVTHKQDMAYLRTLDLGHGYTFDGTTFPLRGSGRGMMPTLSEVLEADLGHQYLINFKSRRAGDGAHLAEILNNPGYRAQVFGVYGGAAPTHNAMASVADLPGFSKDDIKWCIISYALIGWSGYVPPACQTGLIGVPVDIGPYLWGWPHKFTNRMASAGTEVILWGPYDGSGFSSGIDDAETLARVPDGFDGLIWTNRIETIG
ncbi:MAG: glycerophosphodiester phosphodiesterase family protein, partial [Planktomarina sp.]